MACGLYSWERKIMEERPFGRTGENFPILSFGGQRIVDEHGCPEEEALKIVNYALDHGIRYFDTAYVYSDGQAEERLGKVAKLRRNEMWIATKVRARDKQGARMQLETSLKRLQTDHVDEWRMHNVRDKVELDSITGPGGALETAIEARKQGLVRHISISGHSNPRVQIESLERFPFDSVLCATSVLDHFVLSFAEEFLPVAREKGVAVVGMKVLGLGNLGDVYERALRYAFGLPLSTAIVGMETMDQLKKNLETAENYRPLTDEERLEFFKEMLPRVTADVMHWKAEEWNKPVEWKRR
jgi:aryl-alcohol dehydrogenase-like predicted oxidoreductase